MHATATVFPLYWGAEQGWPCGYGTYLMVERRVSSCFTSLRCQVEMKILLPFLSSLFGLQISAPQSTWRSTSLTPQCPGSQLCRVALGPGGDPPTPPPTRNQSAGPAFASSQRSLQPPRREQTLANGGEEANEGGEHLNLRQYFLVVNGSRCGHST